MNDDPGVGQNPRGSSDSDSVLNRDIDWLDQRYLAMQDEVLAEVERHDLDGAARASDQSGQISVMDADGWAWQVAQPQKVLDGRQPDFRFSHRYTKRGPDQRKLLTRRNRFTDVPSLSGIYASQIGGKGLLPWVVKQSEPIGYVAAAAVGVGLWALLSDVVDSLPGVAIVAGVALLAAVLWFATQRLATIPFREARRLSAIVGAAAIGVTGAVPWIATFEASISEAARAAVTSAVTAVAAAILFAVSRRAFPYFVAIIASIWALGTGAFALAESLSTRTPSEMSAQIGVLVAVILLFPIATPVAALRWIPATVVIVAGAGSIAVLAMDWPNAGNLHIAIIALLGFAAAGSSWTSGSFLRRQMRAPHRIGAAALFGASVIILISNLDWDVLADVPLAIVLVTVGSVILIAVAATIRVAVQRISARSESSSDRP